MKKSFTQEEINKKFSSFKTYSSSDMNKVLKNESKLKQMCIDNEPLRDFLDTVSLYIDMLRAIFTGKYKEVPVGTIAAIVGTLLYVLSPIDIIHDPIPVVGFLDDAAVMAACLNFTKYDVDKYKRHLGK